MRRRSVARASAGSKKDALGQALEYVKDAKADIVYRTKARKPYAVLVPVDDDATVEAIEDLLDARTAEKALAELKRTGEQPIPYARVRKELGLR
jgi:hypothetical protein